MPQLNISESLKKLNDYCVLIIDQKHARCLSIKDEQMHEVENMTAEEDLSKKEEFVNTPVNTGTTEERNIDYEHKKLFFKKVLEKSKERYQNHKCKNFILMSSDKDAALIMELLPKNMIKSLKLHIGGNYVNKGQNEVIKKIIEMMRFT
ncbi:hypothetical protein JW887_03265 [Candidatus Dojkabacteria bacterium]|nr:hypothetical protein [Candidatus Dojkabacteria bacterium]